MGPVALFVVLVMFPVAALLLMGGGLALILLFRAASAVPPVSWLGFVAGLLLGAGVLRARRSGVAIRNDRN